ncbi:MAG: hypothetical protein DHS20C17_29810 [Cyclobacteriaceae bacterium]|nr:MAG: hypothetical protein DHS20C17_29810 [Cyclobacteriaceae bacterium]
MKLLASIAVLIGVAFLVWKESGSAGETPNISLNESAMAKAAQSLMETLNADERAQASLPFNDDERSSWHFTPSPHRGLTWEKMNSEQRDAMMKLLLTGLSKKGMDKTKEIMALEEVLRVLEDRPADDRYRHPELYYFMLFGEPGPDPWGWRFEGHHVSLNYTSVGDQLSVTPAFMGANPAEVPKGPHKGKRVLAAEEDLARDLLASFDPDQLKVVLISDQAPEEIVTGMERKAMMGKQEGLAFQKMTDSQQRLLQQLVQNYLGNMEASVASNQLMQIEAEGWDKVFFAWAGETERGPGKAHYYRIHGPSLLIEFDNIQNNANHIHAVWRDLKNDFGEDLLKKHHQHQH